MVGHVSPRQADKSIPQRQRTGHWTWDFDFEIESNEACSMDSLLQMCVSYSTSGFGRLVGEWEERYTMAF